MTSWFGIRQWALCYRAVSVYRVVPSVANASGFPAVIVRGCDSNERSARRCFKESITACERRTLKCLLGLMVTSNRLGALYSCFVALELPDVQRLSCFRVGELSFPAPYET